MHDENTVDNEIAEEDAAILALIYSRNIHQQDDGWQCVLRQYGLRLKHYILKVMDSHRLPPELWEDIAQQTFLTAVNITKAGHHKGQPLYPWLCSIAKNHISNLHRREIIRCKRTFSTEEWDEISAVEITSQPGAEDHMIDEMQQQAEIKQLQEAVAHLKSPEQRLFWAMLQNPEMQYKELAQMLGEHPKTLRNRKSVLTTKLRALMQRKT